MKKMTQVILALGLIFVSGMAQALSSVIIDTEALAMGGAGVSSAIENQGHINPALVGSSSRKDDEFHMIPTVHYIEMEENDFINKLDEFQQNPTLENLQAMEGGEIFYDIAVGFSVLLHSPLAVSTVYINSYSQTHSRLVLDQGDLIKAPDDPYLSQIEISGVTMVETGVTYTSFTSVRFADLGEVKWGVTGKVLTGTAHQVLRPVEEASIDGLYSEGESTQEITMDFGLLKEWGRDWAAGLVVKNLRPVKFNLPDGGEFTYGPQARIGGTYLGHHHRIALDLDLLKSDELGGYGSTQMASLGMDYDVAGYLKLRAGLRYDLQGTLPELYSAGASVNSEYFQISVAVIGNQGEVTGVGLQTSIGF